MENLFGEEIDDKSDLEKDLSEYDFFSFQSRLSRLKYIQSVFPYGSRLMSLQMYYLFTEAKYAFVNGQFVATILLSQASIEQWLLEILLERGYPIRDTAGLFDIEKFLIKHYLIHDYLIEKIGFLRKIRNPFVHLRPMIYSDNLDHRSVDLGVNHQYLLEKDAREAITLMYEIIQRGENIPTCMKSK